MSAWPSTLPQCPLNSQVSGEVKDGVIKSSVPMGQDKYRRRFTALTTTWSIGLVLTTTQYQTLMTFYLANMASEFDWIDPIDNSAAAVTFADRPKISAKRGNYWTVDFSIEVQL